MRKNQKPDQRVIEIDVSKLTESLRHISSKDFRFAPTADYNDVWIACDFDDHEFERATLCFIFRILGQRYSPFEGLEPGGCSCMDSKQ